MTDAILRTEALSVGYGKTVILENVALTLTPGQILTLIGPNGAGKSTLLKTLIGHLPPVSGAVYLDGRDLSALTERDVARNAAAVLSGRPRAELMTCGDVVASGRYPYTGLLGILSGEDREIVKKTMELTHTAELRDRAFDRISDGQRQRVLLSRTICQEPRVLVLDEPTSFLDIKHKLEFLTLLRRLARDRDIAVIVSLHELELARRCSDTLLCVRDGRVDRVGTPEEIFQGGYIDTLYGMEPGSYASLFG